MNHVISLENFSKPLVMKLIEEAEKIKKNPEKYDEKLKGKTLLSIFEKPSLRTRISFETGMKQLGGNAMTIDTQSLPLGKKESLEDTAKVVSRYVDLVMARMYKHEELEKLAENANIPVINGLTDKYHPCQILSDLLTIKEKKGSLKGLKLAFLGDGNNNVTHSLLLGCALAEIDISIGSPNKHWPQIDVIEKARSLSNGSLIEITIDAKNAVSNADVVYADSWMSYHISSDEEKQRLIEFALYQIDEELMSEAKKDAIFMNCLPAQRGIEQTAEVIDGPKSVVFDQAENRLHMQKAIMLYAKGLL